MLAGAEISISITKDYRAGDGAPKTREEIYSAMITLGFLSYSKRRLRIPNKELMIEFEEAIKHESFGKLAEMIRNADEMLDATLNMDNEKVAKIIHDIHTLEIPILNYNDENSLSCVVTLAYLSARDAYIIKREEKAGKGFADFTFRPIYNGDIPIIVELKWNKSADEALGQIVEKEYAKEFIEELKRDILLVGINYDKAKKEHTCAIALVEYNPQY